MYGLRPLLVGDSWQQLAGIPQGSRTPAARPHGHSSPLQLQRAAGRGVPPLGLTLPRCPSSYQLLLLWVRPLLLPLPLLA